MLVRNIREEQISFPVTGGLPDTPIVPPFLEDSATLDATAYSSLTAKICLARTPKIIYIYLHA